jgi:hypothetical protein
MGHVRKLLTELKDVGAKSVLLGVGRGVRNAARTNQQLGEIAKELGIPFTGELEGTDRKGGVVHPDDYGKTARQAKRALGQKTSALGGLNSNRAMDWLKNGDGDFSMAGLPREAYEPAWSYDPGDRPQRETKVNTANNTTNHISVSGVEDPDRAARRIRQEMENLERRYDARTHQTAIA